MKQKVIKNCIYYFFNDMISIKNVGLNKIKIGKNLHTNILIYSVGT